MGCRPDCAAVGGVCPGARSRSFGCSRQGTFTEGMYSIGIGLGRMRGLLPGLESIHDV